MKDLKKVILNNFQSHKHTVVELDPGLNVIVGPSDSGKSAIIRGIKWALYNEPAGDFFIREGESECSVTLIFADKTKLIRKRSRSKNIYELVKSDGEKIRFEGFGTSVPEEIVEEIGITKIYLDSDSSNAINLGEQLEGPFLLSEKASVRASAIGRIVGVNIIDDALRVTIRDRTNASRFKRDLEERIESIEEELKEYDYLDGLSEKVSRAEKLINIIIDKRQTLHRLKKLSDMYNRTKVSIKQLEKQLMKLKDLDRAESLQLQLENLNKDRKYYTKQDQSLKENKLAIEKNQDLLEQLKFLEQVNKLHQKAFEVINLRTNIIQQSGRLKDTKGKIKETEELINKLSPLPGLDRRLDRSQNGVELLDKLSQKKARLRDCQERIKKGKAYLCKFKGTDHAEQISENVREKAVTIKLLKDYKKQLAQVNSGIRKKKDCIKSSDNQIKLELKKYKELLSKTELCPFCLNEITREHIDHIMTHITE